MSTQAFNPYLPSYEYVPDGEPYVFDERLYVFGSHDAFNGENFCVNDYVCWSAPINDLGNWQNEGVIWKSTQDPLAKGKKTPMNAPDVEKGPDGRYYLYYQLAMQKATSVAVAAHPQGPYMFYGHVRHPDGTLYGSKRGDAYSFDPSVFTDDDGKIYMYTGSATKDKFFRFMMKLGGGITDNGVVVQLKPDMLTVVDGNQRATIPGCFTAKGTPFAGHGFYEASSMRKINGRYYLVYSSELSHELCYAISKTPVGPWSYGGTLVSNGDIGLPGVKDVLHARNFTGNTHGGMTEINGQWYIFYHRQTNQQMCARQGCAEPITILPNGNIPQAEMTSCGLNGGPLRAISRYEARIACNLWSKRGTFFYTKAHHAEETYPYFTQSGTDREQNGDQYIANIADGSAAGFKYFDFNACAPNYISVRVRGSGGRMNVYCDLKSKPVAQIPIAACNSWQEFSASITNMCGVLPLYFVYNGTGKIDFDSFELK